MTNTNVQKPNTKKYEALLVKRLETIEKRYSTEDLQFPNKKDNVHVFATEICSLYEKEGGVLGVIADRELGDLEGHLISTLNGLARKDVDLSATAYANLNSVYATGNLEVVDDWVSEALSQGNYSNLIRLQQTAKNDYGRILNARNALNDQITKKEADNKNEKDANKKADTESMITSLKATLADYDKSQLPQYKKAFDDAKAAADKEKSKVIDFLNLKTEGSLAYADLRAEYVTGQRKKIAVGYIAAGLVGLAALVAGGVAVNNYLINGDLNEENADLTKKNKSLEGDKDELLNDNGDLSDKLGKETKRATRLQITLDSTKKDLDECSVDLGKTKETLTTTTADYDTCVDERDTLHEKCGDPDVICKDKTEWKTRRVVRRARRPKQAPPQKPAFRIIKY